MKRELANVATELSTLAAIMPDHKPKPARREPPEAREKAPAVRKPKPKEPKERLPQFSLALRKELRHQLDRLAYDARMTMRAFVLDALKAKGLKVRDDDLTDLRKRP